MTFTTTPFTPPNWIKELTRLQPATWNYWHSARSALIIALPLLIGLLTKQLDLYLWVSLGAMLQMSGERSNTYPMLFKRLVVIAPVGAAGFLLGYLSELPWGTTALIMSALAFGSAILSSYSSALSIATMQMLMMGTVAIGNTHITAYVQAALLTLVGSAVYAGALALEALLLRHRPKYEAQLKLINALVVLATHRAQAQYDQTDSQAVSGAMDDLYALMFQYRLHSQGRNRSAEQIGRSLQYVDQIFAGLMASTDVTRLQLAQSLLEQLKQAVASKQQTAPVFIQSSADPLATSIQGLSEILWNQNPIGAVPTLPQTAHAPKERWKISWAKLNPGKEVWLSASALALCVFLAYSLRYIDNLSHWYWVPMTVILVIKPDLGSVFTRTVLRCLGTSLGVLVGAAILFVVPSGPYFVVLLAILGWVLPWAAQRSYAFMSLIVTPLVLVLIDLIAPQAQIGVNYAWLRFEDTLIGGGIALVFGYLIWPKKHVGQLRQSFALLRQILAQYLQHTLAVAAHTGDTTQAESTMRASRRAAYGQITSIRTQLQKQLANPPPVNLEAMAWFPFINTAARLCDDITAYSFSTHVPLSTQELQQLQRLATQIASTPVQQLHIESSAESTSSPASYLISRINEELLHVQALVNKK